MNFLDPYMKAVIPGVLTIIAALGSVYGTLPWWGWASGLITTVLTFLVRNTQSSRQSVAGQTTITFGPGEYKVSSVTAGSAGGGGGDGSGSTA